MENKGKQSEGEGSLGEKTTVRKEGGKQEGRKEGRKVCKDGKRDL